MNKATAAFHNAVAALATAYTEALQLNEAEHALVVAQHKAQAAQLDNQVHQLSAKLGDANDRITKLEEELKRLSAKDIVA